MAAGGRVEDAVAEPAEQAASLVLGRDVASVRIARRFIDERLREWGLSALIDDAGLVASELVTNAVLHAGTDVTLVVRRRGGAVRVEVHDQSPDHPSPPHEDTVSAMTGRGLLVVERVAGRWGVTDLALGKATWAELSLRSPTGPTMPTAPTEPFPLAAAPTAAGRGASAPVDTTSWRRVVLQGLPVRLALAADGHLDDLAREFQVLSAAEQRSEALAVVPEAASLLDRFAAARHANAAEANQAADRGEERFDLELLMPETAIADLERLADVLDRLGELAHDGRLLTPPPTPESIAFRRWCASEIARQMNGRPPTPCPFEAETSGLEGPAGLEDVRLREARYRSLIEAADLDVWRANASGELVTDMPEWRSHTGQPPHELLGLGWMDGVHPDHRERVEDTWRRAVAEGAPYVCEYPIVAADGTVRDVVARATPVFDGGVLHEWIGTTSDVTEQRRAGHELSEQTRIVQALYEIGLALATTLDLDDLLRRLVETTTRNTGAQFGAFFFNTVDGDGEEYRLVTLHGASMDDFERFGTPRNTKLFAPTFAGESIVRYDDVTTSPGYGQNPPHHGMPDGHLPVRSYLAVPVVSANGAVHGGLFFGHPNPGVFTDAHERLLAAISAQAAIAIDNALLLEAERAARAAAEAAQWKNDLLSSVSDRLAASLDVDATAKTLAEAVVPALADWVVVRAGDDAGTAQVELGAPPANPVRSAGGLAVDLRSGDRDVGWMAVGAADGAPLARDAVDAIEAIARRGGMALDNALLYRRQRSAALILQETLLPRERPPLPGFTYAIRYLPASTGTAVGGDWYDVVRLTEDTAVVAVGDVQGKGIEAAAHMGQLRAGKRAYTLAGLSPSAVLQLLDRMWELQTDVLATCVHTQVELSTGALRIAAAGHLPPLRFGAGRGARELDLQVGPPIGVGGGQYPESLVTLDAGEGLVLFTDGLVEHRLRSIDEGLSLLRQAIDDVTAGDWTAEAVADAALGRMLDGAHDDDVALLVLRRES